MSAHHWLSKTILQEGGRCGRDRAQSDAVILAFPDVFRYKNRRHHEGICVKHETMSEQVTLGGILEVL